MATMDKEDFLKSVEEYWDAIRETGQNSKHLLVSNEKIAIVCIPGKLSQSKAFSELGERARQYRQLSLLEFMDQLMMSEIDVIQFLLRKYRKEVLVECKGNESKLKRALQRSGIHIPIRAEVAAAYLLTKNITVREAQGMRTYLGANIPTTEEIREAKHMYLQKIPSMYLRFINSNEWVPYPVTNLRVSIENSRSIQCARLNLREMLTSQLCSLDKIDAWPKPPVCGLTKTYDIDTTVVLMICIDSGTGSTKVMCRFLKEGGGQGTQEVMLLSQAHGETESFEFFEKNFRCIADELADIENNNLLINEKEVRVLPVFTCDLKATWVMSGIAGANCSHPCPFCSVHVSQLDRDWRRVERDLPSTRPAIQDLRGNSSTSFQKAGTYNLFHLRSFGSDAGFPNIGPAILHIKLGIGNKVVSALDKVMAMWATGSEYEKKTRAHLAMCLSNIGAHRKQYYSGQLSGGQCGRLLSNLDSFCHELFDTTIETIGTAKEKVEGVNVLHEDLKKLSGLYNGNEDIQGLGYFLHTQETWTSSMKIEWRNVCSQFTRVFYKAIGRPALRGSERPLPERYHNWRVPLRMTKLHILVTHSTDIVDMYGSLGGIAEESFEHTQSVSLSHRETHSANMCAGIQITEDLIYAWLRSFPDVHNALTEHEKRLISSKRGIKKRQFSSS